MAGEPAIQKIADGLKAALTGTATTVEVDRPEDDAYGKGEIGALGALNIRHTTTVFEPFDHATTLHRAAFDIGMIVEVKPGPSNAARLREMEADLVAALWADRTLGGLAQDVQPQASGGDDDVRTDEGERSLSVEVLFLTPVGDHRTIIGPAGPIP